MNTIAGGCSSAPKMACRLDARHARHTDIQQHDSGIETAHEPERFEPRRAHACDAKAGQLADEPLQPLTCGQLVVDDQHT